MSSRYRQAALVALGVKMGNAGPRGSRIRLGWWRSGNKGTVSIMFALGAPALIGFVALVAEFGFGLAKKTEIQRIADVAAFAAATNYASTGNAQAIQSAAAAVAVTNGLPASSVTASLTTSPRGDGNQAVLVKVATSNVLLLAPVLGYGRLMPIAASAYAEIAPTAGGCVVATAPNGSGVTLSGGTSLTTASCSVASDAAVTVPCGTSITAKSVSYNSALSQPCNGITGPTKKAAITDPFAADPTVAALQTHESAVANDLQPSGPVVKTGTDVSFAYSQSTTISAVAADGCNASFSGSTWTVTCTDGGTYNFGAISLGGGITVKFATTSTRSTFNFSGLVQSNGTAMSFGSGTFNLAKGLSVSGNAATTFGSGTFNIGTGASCNGSSYSLCTAGSSVTSFAGPSTFVLQDGFYNAGGSTLTLGSGTGNSFRLGAAANGDAITTGGGSKTTLADATGGTFELDGNLNAAAGGGSCLAIGASSEHDIDGFLSLAGGTTLGAGVYTATGYIGFGINGGGDVTCNGLTIGVSGTGVTLMTGGLSTISGGSCAGDVFCIASGFAHVTLTAPTSGPGENFVVVGPTTSAQTGGALLTGGSSNTSLSGVMYFREGALALSGGAGLGQGSGQCLQLVATSVSLSGGSAAASACVSASGSSGGLVAVVQ